MPVDQIRVAMIGCGGNARGHMTRLQQLKGVKIVGLCDPAAAAIEATLKALPNLKGVPVFSDYREMLAAVACEAVEISTPHTQHFAQIMASLNKGCHVLTEKPMVCTVPHAQKIVTKVKKTGLVFGVAYQRHSQAPYRYCRELIASGETGKVNFITALQSQNWFRGCVLSGLWRGKIALSGGGQLNDSGSHLLDIVLWMSGLQPAEVFAYQDNLKSEVDILTAMSVSFDGGAMANFSVVGHAVNWLEDITFWCEDLTLAIRGSEVWQWRDDKREVVSAEKLGPSGDPDANFIASIRGKEKPQATADDGLKVIQLSEAAWRSAAEKQPAAVVR
jgi:predicted dehydrogenase